VPQPDKIFYNGEIVTLDFGLNTVNSLAVSGDRIIATGRDEDILALKGANTQIIDLGGRTVLPGFIDAHGHFMFNAFFKTKAVDLNSPPIGHIHTMNELIAALKEKADRTPEGEDVIGFGYDDTMLKEQRQPTRDDLDQVSTKHRVYIYHISGHMAVVNSRIIDGAGLTGSEPQPEGGRYWKDENGRPSGVFEEMPGYKMVDLGFPQPTPEDLLEIVENGSHIYLAAGATSTQDGATLPMVLDGLRFAHQSGALKIRVDLWPLHTFPVDPYPTHVSGTPLTDDRMITIGAYKIVNDGSIQCYTAYLSSPYYRPHPTQPKEPLYRGYSIFSSEELHAAVLERHKQGWQIAVHGNGDATIEEIINAMEAAQKTWPRNDARHIIVHCQTVREDQLDRMQRLGIIPSFFATHTYYWGDRHRELFLGPHRAEMIDPCNSAYVRGMPFTCHNDPMVTPIDPLLSIWSATNRITASGKVLGPNQCVPVLEAVRSVTTHAAFQAFSENHKGSLEVGKLADMVVLDANPLTIDPVKIKDIEVLATIVGGNVVYGEI
jgi:predicted amidohydrolase YtcJ